MIKVDSLQLIGEFTVDSGQAMVGDPCYLDSWKHWNQDNDEKFDEYEKHKGEYGYLGACETTIKRGFGELGDNSAVAFTTGYGDGIYPVYAQLNEDGRVAIVVIDFTGEYNIDE